MGQRPGADCVLCRVEVVEDVAEHPGRLRVVAVVARGDAGWETDDSVLGVRHYVVRAGDSTADQVVDVDVVVESLESLHRGVRMLGSAADVVHRGDDAAGGEDQLSQTLGYEIHSVGCLQLAERVAVYDTDLHRVLAGAP